MIIDFGISGKHGAIDTYMDYTGSKTPLKSIIYKKKFLTRASWYRP